MLSVFLNCDLQNKSSLYNSTQINFFKNRAISQASGLQSGPYSQKGGIVFLLLHSHHLDLTLCFQGVYHQGLRTLQRALVTPAGAARATGHMTERPHNSPSCPHHHHHPLYFTTGIISLGPVQDFTVFILKSLQNSILLLVLLKTIWNQDADSFRNPLYQPVSGRFTQ